MAKTREELERRIEALELALKEQFISLYDMRRWGCKDKEEYSFGVSDEAARKNVEKYGTTSDFYRSYMSIVNLKEAMKIDPTLDQEVFNPWKAELAIRNEKRRIEGLERAKQARIENAQKLINRRPKSKRTVNIDDLLGE